MKKRLLKITLIFAMLLSMALPQITTAAEENGKKVDMIFVHDLHSHLNEFSTVDGEKTVTVGGFSRMKTIINKQKEKNPDTLIVDAGDFSMGTLVQVVYDTEAAELRMLGELGVEVTTFGNHEYDYKAAGIANMLNNAVNSGDVLPEIVVCNLDWEAMENAGFTEDQKLIKNSFQTYGVKDYTMVEKNGVKIAVVGVFGNNAVACVADCPVVFADPVESVKATVAKIEENEDADMIVCVSHGGTWSDPEESEDEILAKAVPELDVIVSGHTHTKLEEPIQHGSTYIVSCAEYGKMMGNMSLSQNPDGSWTMDNYELIPVTPEVEADAATQEKVNDFMDLVDSKYLAQFGYTKDQVLCINEVEFCDQDDLSNKHTELNLGSIIADAYAYAVESAPDFDGIPVDFAVAPSGTIRETYGLGNITTEKVFNSFSLGIGPDGIPGYPLISVYLTGEELLLAVEIDSSISDLMTTARLYAHGVHWSFNPNRMILNKTTDAYLVKDGQRVEIEKDKLYRVVTDLYSAKMLGGVTDMSYGLLSLVSKNADGTPIEKYEDAIVHVEGQELKAWAAIAKYMTSFEDTDGDNIPNVPAVYAEDQGRKVVEDSKAFGDLIKNPNKFFFGITAVAALLLVLIVLLFMGLRQALRKIRGKKA